MPIHTDPARGERVLLGKLEMGAPCTLGPDEIDAAVNIINERERLISDRDLWKRTAQRLEREKIALAQDVLTNGEKRRAQAEALRAAADDCVPAMHQMAHWLRGRAEALVKPGDASPWQAGAPPTFREQMEGRYESWEEYQREADTPGEES